MRIGRFIVFVAAITTPLLHGQAKKVQNPATEWPLYNHDLAGSRDSPLAQINVKNVARLTQAWTYKLPRHPTSGGTPAATN
jgi:glucose dehydrogenase